MKDDDDEEDEDEKAARLDAEEAKKVKEAEELISEAKQNVENQEKIWCTQSIHHQVDLSGKGYQGHSFLTTGNPGNFFNALFIFNRTWGGSDLDFQSDRVACRFFIQEGTEIEASMIKIDEELHQLTFLLINGDPFIFQRFYEAAYAMWLKYLNDHKP